MKKQKKQEVIEEEPMKKQERIAEVLRLLNLIEEEAPVDFLGTGSDSRWAAKLQKEWEDLFVRAREHLAELSKGL